MVNTPKVNVDIDVENPWFPYNLPIYIYIVAKPIVNLATLKAPVPSISHSYPRWGETGTFHVKSCSYPKTWTPPVVPTMWGPRSIAKLVNITPLTMVYNTQITIVFIGVYKPT